MTNPARQLHTPEPEPQTLVCDIRRIPNEAHMHRCAQAIRNRDPAPLWSWSGFRVTGGKRLRAVRP